MASDWSPVEVNVITQVHQHGALTTRRLIQAAGPKPNWQHLIGDLLTEHRTIYGRVIAYNREGYDWARAVSGLPGAPAYLLGPGAAADRAYQNDALMWLGQRGYTVHRHEYRKGHKPDTRTSQIIRTVMRVPSEVMLNPPPPEPDIAGILKEAPGYPSLYASISGGGIKLAKVKALLKRHRHHIAGWGHPLLIALPGDEDIRPYLRGVEAKFQRVREELFQEGKRKNTVGIPRVRLIHLPLPGEGE